MFPKNKIFSPPSFENHKNYLHIIHKQLTICRKKKKTKSKHKRYQIKKTKEMLLKINTGNDIALKSKK